MQSERTAGQYWGKLRYSSFPASKLGHRVWGMETKAAFSLDPSLWCSAMFLRLVCLCLSRGHSCTFPSVYSYQGSEASYSTESRSCLSLSPLYSPGASGVGTV